MNRRDFLRTALLVLPALVTKFQLEPEKLEVILASDEISDDFENWPEPLRKGYEMGQRVMEGYVEGVQGDISGMVITIYDHTDWDKVKWDDIPDAGLMEPIELEWQKAPVMRWSDRPVNLWGESLLKPKFEIEKLEG